MTIPTGKFGWFPTLILVIVSNATSALFTYIATTDHIKTTKIEKEESLQHTTQPEAQTSQEADSPSPLEIDSPLPFVLAVSSDSLVGETVTAIGDGQCLELPNRAGVFEDRSIRQDCQKTDHPYIEIGQSVDIIWSHPDNNGLHAAFFEESETIGWISESNFKLPEDGAVDQN